MQIPDKVRFRVRNRRPWVRLVASLDLITAFQKFSRHIPRDAADIPVAFGLPEPTPPHVGKSQRMEPLVGDQAKFFRRGDFDVSKMSQATSGNGR